MGALTSTRICRFDFQNGVPSVRQDEHTPCCVVVVVVAATSGVTSLIVEPRAHARCRSREVTLLEKLCHRARSVGRREKKSFLPRFPSFFFPPSSLPFSHLDGNPDGNLDGNLPNGVLRGIQSVNSVPPCCDRLVLSLDVLSITLPLCERVNWKWNERIVIC